MVLQNSGRRAACFQFPPISADVQQLPAVSQHMTGGSAAEQRISIFLALPANKWDDGFGQVALEKNPARDGRTGRPPLRTD
ncbi:hypothetical protein [Mesorhizobium ciceri]|uniref:hypothetical protein n=1 Tax=Mesorhizobium TaxID=68287 RepID=UPI0012DF11EE|nr:hypothetical protein [Mesorhizobium ciceri]